MVSHGSPKPLSWVRFPPPLPQKSLLISAANIESGIRVVERIVADLGYKGVTLADLALSEDETGKIDYIKKMSEHGVLFYSATREDRTLARAIVRPTGRGDYAAEIFSPAFNEGHGSNHDFNEAELTGSLKTALMSPSYQSPKF